MSSGLDKRPKGVSFNRLSDDVFVILERYTAFPWPVLSAQAKRCGADPAALTSKDLPKLIEHLAIGVERFTSPQKGDAVRAELVALARTVGVSILP